MLPDLCELIFLLYSLINFLGLVYSRAIKFNQIHTRCIYQESDPIRSNIRASRLEIKTSGFGNNWKAYIIELEGNAMFLYISCSITPDTNINNIINVDKSAFLCVLFRFPADLILFFVIIYESLFFLSISTEFNEVFSSLNVLEYVGPLVVFCLF